MAACGARLAEDATAAPVLSAEQLPGVVPEVSSAPVFAWNGKHRLQSACLQRGDLREASC